MESNDMTRGGWFASDDPAYLETRPDDRVSYSTLHKLARGCEQAALWGFSHPPEETDDMRFGSLVDLMLLEPDKLDDKLAICPGVGEKGVWSAKYKEEVVKPQRALGKLCIKEKDADEARVCVESILAHEGGWLTERFNFGELDPDRTVRYQEQAWFYEGDQAVSLRVDINEWVDGEIAAITDLKLTNDPSPRAWQTAVHARGYDIQAAVYARAAIVLCGQKKPPAYSWLVVGSKPPHTPNLYTMSDRYMQYALETYGKAIEHWAGVKHLPLNQTAGHNGYQGVGEIDLPGWL